LYASMIAAILFGFVSLMTEGIRLIIGRPVSECRLPNKNM
jgi:hypothetical protein